jgi:hypothetical protein
MSYIPVIIITEDGSSFNYFNGIESDAREKEFFITTNNKIIYDFYEKAPFISRSIVYKTDNEQLRNRVLELLHEAVRDCFVSGEVKAKMGIGNESGVLTFTNTRQVNFQIKLSDIIQKAKQELEMDKFKFTERIPDMVIGEEALNE